MCLKTTQDFSIITDQDITCYKVMLQYKDGKLLSPYKGYQYTLGKEESAVLGHARSEFSYGYEVEEGLHTLAHLDEAQSLREKGENELIIYGSPEQQDQITYVIMECIIPAGSEVYAGSWSLNSLASYASNKLQPIRILGKENVS